MRMYNTYIMGVCRVRKTFICKRTRKKVFCYFFVFVKQMGYVKPARESKNGSEHSYIKNNCKRPSRMKVFKRGVMIGLWHVRPQSSEEGKEKKRKKKKKRKERKKRKNGAVRLGWLWVEMLATNEYVISLSQRRLHGRPPFPQIFRSHSLIRGEAREVLILNSFQVECLKLIFNILRVMLG